MGRIWGAMGRIDVIFRPTFLAWGANEVYLGRNGAQNFFLPRCGRLTRGQNVVGVLVLTHLLDLFLLLQVV